MTTKTPRPHPCETTEEPCRFELMLNHCTARADKQADLERDLAWTTARADILATDRAALIAALEHIAAYDNGFNTLAEFARAALAKSVQS